MFVTFPSALIFFFVLKESVVMIIARENVLIHVMNILLEGFSIR
jgi:hypothetical protein